MSGSSLTAAELAKETKQTPQTVRNWIRQGLPATKEEVTGRFTMKRAEALRWVKQYADLTGRRRNGGKRAGAGAKPGVVGVRSTSKARSGRAVKPSPANDIDSAKGPKKANPVETIPGKVIPAKTIPGKTIEDIPLSEIIGRLESGDTAGLTVGQIALASDALTLREKYRKAQRDAGLLLDASEVADEWQKALIEIDQAVSGLPNRVSQRAAAGYPQTVVMALRKVLVEEVEALKAMLAGSKNGSLPRSSPPTSI